MTAPIPVRKRRVLILLASILVSGYSAGVFSYVLTIPDIGLRCAFDEEVNRVFPEFIYDQDPDTARDLVGSSITKIGKDKVESWPHVLRLLIQLRSDEAVPIDNAEQLDPAKEPHVRLDGVELIYVELQRPGEDTPTGIWCKPGRAPMTALLPSILWFLLKGSLFVVAALVFWKQPLDRSRAMFFWLSLCTVGAYIGGFHWWRIATQPVLLVVFVVSSVLLPAVSLHFYLVFPRPKEFLQRFPVRSLMCLYALPGIFLVLLLSGCFRVRWLYSGGSDHLILENVLGSFCDWAYGVAGAPRGLTGALALMREQIGVYLAIAALFYLASLACLGHSFRTVADPMERNQVKCILLGS